MYNILNNIIKEDIVKEYLGKINIKTLYSLSPITKIIVAILVYEFSKKIFSGFLYTIFFVALLYYTMNNSEKKEIKIEEETKN